MEQFIENLNWRFADFDNNLKNGPDWNLLTEGLLFNVLLCLFFSGQISERIPEPIQMSLSSGARNGGQPWRYEPVISETKI
jgi:hypothetical protein